MPKTSAGIFGLSDIASTRAAIHAMAEAADAAGPQEADIAVEVHAASRPDGPDLGLRLFRSVDSSGPLPALMWFHGGGQVLGFAAQEDASLKRIAREVGRIVVAVDYRLAPETPAPAAAEDGYFALYLAYRRSGRARHRRRPDWDRGCQRRRRYRRGGGADDPRPRGAAAPVPGAQLPDDRRPQRHRVEPCHN